MDALTQLCSRFSDAAVLLANLRDAGCRDCVDVERFDVEALSARLGASREFALQLQSEARVLLAGTPAPLPQRSMPLRPALLPELDLEHCMHLRRLGIDSIEDLAAAGVLELAGALDVGVERVMRWQTLARRALDSGVASTGVHEVTLAPAAHPPRDPVRPTSRFSPTETDFVPRPGSLERDLASFGAGQGPRERDQRA